MAKITSKRVVAFNVPQTSHEIVRVQQDVDRYFYDQLHQHPEIQIMLIAEGEGTLVAGDYVGRFRAGDVYVIGGGLPHVFRCDPSYYKEQRTARSTSLYFSERYFGQELWSVNEMKAVRELAETSRRGIQLMEPDNTEAARIIHNIANEQGLRRIHAFIELLALITDSNHAIKLTLQPGRLVQQEEERMNRILEFTFRESHRKIYLEEVAQQAHLSEEAFCRYFRLHTRKTYISFLNEVRISQACQHLIHGENSVEDVCDKVGFTNISNFNRIFKRTTGKTPLKFRQQAWGQTGGR